MSRTLPPARLVQGPLLALAAAALLCSTWLAPPAQAQDREGPRSATRQGTTSVSTPSSPPSRSAAPAPSRSSAPSANRGGSAQSERSDRRSRSDRRRTATQTDRSTGVANSGDAADTAYSSRGRGRGNRHGNYRGHRGHRGYYHSSSYYSPFYRGHWWGSWWTPWWGFGASYPGPVYVGHGPGDGLGALDLDVSPEEASIYLDGQRLGIADNYDGFPEYLWLKEGTYDLVIYLPGFETIARQVSIYSGVVIDVEDRMVPGQAIAPEELASTSTVNREERLRRNEERGEAVDAQRRSREDAWRQRAREYQRRQEGSQGDTPSSSLDARSVPARLDLQIEPSDASVYLNGRFLGTAEDLQNLSGDLLVDAGDHEIEVVHPDYEAATQAFSVESGERRSISLRLEPER